MRRRTNQKDFGWITWIWPCCLLALTFGCQSSAKRYTLTGQVLAKSESAGQVSVANDNIPGFMSAMTMNYPVKDSQGLQQVQPGDRIRADVVVQNGGNNYWLEHIAITDQSARGSIGAATKPHELLQGEKVPDVPLVNQDGKALHLADFKGKAVLLTFIYTRCPFPTFCPLISSELAAIHSDLAQTPAVYQKTHLVSVSLDPSYDTAPVLHKYGLAYLKGDASGFGHWDFVSTSFCRSAGLVETKSQCPNPEASPFRYASPYLCKTGAVS